MNKIELAQKIQSIEGLTTEERTALLGLLRSSKKYGLVWEDKPEAVEQRFETELPVLKEVPSRSIMGGGSNSLNINDIHNHVLIEGDNLEALTALTYTHEGKIDVIYIDPPYNTGHDFIYNDKLIDSSDDFKHSYWLSFISKRLKIAKSLLKETGVLFISIDDNEQAQLKLLCDEVFNNRNFITEFCVIRAEGGGMAKQVIKGHDYCLAYAKNINLFRPLGKPKDIRGKIVAKDGVDYWIQEDWLRKEFGKYGNCHYEELVEYKGLDYKAEIDQGIANGLYVLIPKANGMNIIGKLRRIDEDSSKFYSILKFLNKDGVNELKEMGIHFDYPKPKALIAELIRGASLFNKNAIILDFFAGSGTTLHATMQLNAEDGGHRQCILVTNNENGICENVTYERNKRVIEGYTKPNGEFVEGLHNNNLRYYKTAFVGRRRTPQNMRRLMLLATDMLSIKENLYTEQEKFAGMPTIENGFRYFSDGKKQMLIIYNEDAIYDIIEKLETIDVEQPIITYVFSPANDPWRSEFETVADRVTLTALPAAIYNAYKRVLPKPKDIILAEEEKASEPITQSNDLLFNFEKGGEA